MSSTAQNLYITNFPEDTTIDSLKNYIIKKGFQTSKVSIIKGKKAIVTFTDQKQCRIASLALNGSDFNNYKLNVSYKDKNPKIKLPPPQYEIFLKQQKTLEKKYKVTFDIDIKKMDKIVKIKQENKDLESEIILKEIQTNLIPFSTFIKCEIPQDKLDEIESLVQKNLLTSSFSKDEKKGGNIYNIYGNAEFLDEVKKLVGKFDLVNSKPQFESVFHIPYAGFFQDSFVKLKDSFLEKYKDEKLEINFESSNQKTLFFKITSDSIELNQNIRKTFENEILSEKVDYNLKDQHIVNGKRDFFEEIAQREKLILSKSKEIEVIGLKSQEKEIRMTAKEIATIIAESQSKLSYSCHLNYSYPFFKKYLCSPNNVVLDKFLNYLKSTFKNFNVDTELRFKYVEDSFTIRIEGNQKSCRDFYFLLLHLEEMNHISNIKIKLTLNKEPAKYIYNKIKKEVDLDFTKIIVSEPFEDRFSQKSFIEVEITGLIDDKEKLKKIEEEFKQYQYYVSKRLEFSSKKRDEVEKSLKKIEKQQYIEAYYIPNGKHYVFINSPSKEYLKKAQEEFEKLTTEKMITLNVEIPSFLRDKFEIEELTKSYPNLKFDYKERNNTLSINGIKSLVEKTHESLKLKVIELENQTEKSIYYSMDPDFSYLLTHGLKDEYKRIITEGKVQVQGLLGTPFKTACTAKLGTILVELLVGDISRTNTDYLVCPIDSKFSKDYGLAELVVRRSGNITFDPNKVDKDKIYFTSNSELKCKNVAFFPCTDIQDDTEYLEKIELLFGQLSSEINLQLKNYKTIKTITFPSFCEKYPRRRSNEILGKIYKMISQLCIDVSKIEKVYLITNETKICELWAKMIQNDQRYIKNLDYKRVLNYPLKQKTKEDRIWYFKTKEKWYQFPPSIMNEIQAGLENEDAIIDITMNYVNYTIHFKNTRNGENLEKYYMKRVTNGEEFLIINENPFWFYEHENKWIQFPKNVRTQLQIAYENYLKEQEENKITINSEGTDLDIDFEKMIARNEKNIEYKINFTKENDNLKGFKIEILKDPKFYFFEVEIKGKECENVLLKLNDLYQKVRPQKTHPSIQFPPKQIRDLVEYQFNVELKKDGEGIIIIGFEKFQDKAENYLLREKNNIYKSNDLLEWLRSIECLEILKFCEDHGITKAYFSLFYDKYKKIMGKLKNGKYKELSKHYKLLKENSSKLTSLDLSGKSFNGTDLRKLLIILDRNTSLTSLDLSNNLIGDIGAYYLQGILERNNTIKSLNISNNKFTQKGFEMIKEGMKSNNIINIKGIDHNDREIKKDFTPISSDSMNFMNYDGNQKKTLIPREEKYKFDKDLKTKLKSMNPLFIRAFDISNPNITKIKFEFPTIEDYLEFLGISRYTKYFHMFKIKNIEHQNIDQLIEIFETNPESVEGLFENIKENNHKYLILKSIEKMKENRETKTSTYDDLIK